MNDTELKTSSNTEIQKQQNDSLLGDEPQKADGIIVGKQPLNMRQRLKDPTYRNKLVQSWLIVLAFFSLGLYGGLNGVTLLDLQIITSTDLERASAFVTGLTSGYMIGCLVIGAIFNKVSMNLLLFMAMFGLGAVLIATPYCSNYPLMISVRVISGFFAGSIDTSGNAGHMWIWGNEGKVLMQIIHFSFAIGGVFAPVYSEPFLAKRPSMIEVNTTNSTNGNGSSELLTVDSQTTNVHYAFIVTGVFMFISSVPFIVMFIKNVRQTEQEERQIVGDNIIQRKLPWSLHVFIQTLICTFFMFYCCIELTFSNFIMPFLVNEYRFMTKATSVYITTIYWVSFAVSRFLMIFVSQLLSVVCLLFLCLTLMVIAYTGFIISAVFGSITALSVFTATAGLGMSGIFATAFSWAESELLKVTARVSSSISIVASTGKIFNPLLLGFMMEELTNMWFCYFLVGETAILCLLFAFLLLFNRYYVDKKYCSLSFLRQAAAVSENSHSRKLF